VTAVELNSTRDTRMAGCRLQFLLPDVYAQTYQFSTGKNDLPGATMSCYGPCGRLLQFLLPDVYAQTYQFSTGKNDLPSATMSCYGPCGRLLQFLLPDV
jgi:hypothetical protein